MIKLDQAEYLGKDKRAFSLGYITITETEYLSAVSEDWHYHVNSHLTLIAFPWEEILRVRCVAPRIKEIETKCLTYTRTGWTKSKFHMSLQSSSILQRSMKAWVLTLYFIISFYCFGALVIENDVNYRTWYFIGSNDFPVFHKHLETRLFPVFMLPLALQLFFSLALLWVNVATINRQYRWALVSLNIYILVISFLLLVPIHEELNIHKTDVLIDKLIRTHELYRLPAETLLFILNSILLFKLLRRGIPL
jgi:hypothetical protein